MRTTFLAALLLIPLPASADDITDALNAAISAYEEGEIGDALGEIAYATQLLNALQAQGLTAFLPEPLPGYTREVSEDASSSLGFLGGGTAAEATYEGPNGRFTITMMADNPMVASMAGILGNAGIIATMGQLERINRENFMVSDNELSGLIGGRILIQASGGEIEDMVAHLEQIDFGELEGFGQ
ncbi:hypothetical protein HKCCE4037_09015 [Rhodobacterales bacterium HKCCE4037]|nr:hypothetical protein [Rhodobacterales bacterium HKCCE4037]